MVKENKFLSNEISTLARSWVRNLSAMSWVSLSRTATTARQESS